MPIEIEAEIRRLHYAEHWPVGTVARHLDVHEDVVRRVVGLLPPRRAFTPRKRVVDGYVELIDEILKEYPTLRVTSMHDMLRERGLKGAVRTLRDYVATVRPAPRREAFLRLVPLGGEQAQIDWAYVGDAAVASGKRPLWLFVIEQKRKRRAQPVSVGVGLGDHINDRDVVSHDLESYDANRRRD